MEKVYPDYYREFRCIADRCRHNCCIGWEIDVDEDTAARYRTVEGSFGDRLRNSVAWEETPHFLLDDAERCPFLNDRNLCDIITVLGEGSLCTICREHPRFVNELPERLEIGLGLCCEAAARLILGKKTPMILDVQGKRVEPDEILMLRDEVLTILQNRDIAIDGRINEMLSRCGVFVTWPSVDIIRDFLLSLEIMDCEWSELLRNLSEESNDVGFASHMAARQEEYENLISYLVYRHFANAWNREEAALRAAFAAFGYRLAFGIGERLYRRNKQFTFEDQVEVCRLFSAEIEYSQENRDAILDWLSGYVFQDADQRKTFQSASPAL